MEPENERSLFDMQIDQATLSNLQSISRWTKFIAITGFVAGGLLLVFLLVYGEQILEALSSVFSMGDNRVAGTLILVLVLGAALVGGWLFFLLRSSRLIRKGLENRSSLVLAEGFRALRIYFIFSFILSLLSILSSVSAIL